jgi:type I restriction enzyme S subunit
MSQGWTWKPLGEVCKTGSGGTPLSSRKEFYEGGTIPWLVSGEVAQGNVREAKNFITAAGLENSAAKLFPRDTVLVAMYGATAGQVGILRFEATTNQAVCGILPNNKFVPEFLYYFLLAKKDDLVAQATGNAQPNISQIKIKNTEVPVLPLPEQQRIVALLDEAFTGLASAQANADQNLQNARALFESHLQAVFSERGEGWVEMPLADCLELITYGFTNPMPTTAEGPFMITAKNVNGGRIDYETARRTSWEAYNDLLTDKSRPQVGDVLLTKDGTLGRVAVVDRPGICVNQSVAVLRPNGRMHPEFMRSLLSSPKYQRRMADDAGGTTIKHIYITRVDKMLVTFPELLQEQSRLSSHLDFLAIETQRLTRLYERKLAALEELKKSLLHQAFNGEL